MQTSTMTARDADTVANIFAVLLSSRFRKGSLRSMDADRFAAEHRDIVATRVRRGAPIQLTLVGFPFKVPNPLKVGGRTMPDLAEVAALQMLERLHLAVRAVYAPGIDVVILHDGSYIADAFGVSHDEASEYAAYFRRLVDATATAGFVRGQDITELLPGRETSAAAGLPSPATDDFRKTLGMVNVRGLPRDRLPAVLDRVGAADPRSLTGTSAVLYSQVRRSMTQYAARDAFLRRFDPRPRVFPEAIHATTKSQPGRLALWLVRRGRALLPWHGVGVVTETGRIDVRYASDVEASDRYRPVFLEGESTPFFYAHVAADYCESFGRRIRSLMSGNARKVWPPSTARCWPVTQLDSGPAR